MKNNKIRVWIIPESPRGWPCIARCLPHSACSWPACECTSAHCVCSLWLARHRESVRAWSEIHPPPVVRSDNEGKSNDVQKYRVKNSKRTEKMMVITSQHTYTSLAGKQIKSTKSLPRSTVPGPRRRLLCWHSVSFASGTCTPVYIYKEQQIFMGGKRKRTA